MVGAGKSGRELKRQAQSWLALLLLLFAGVAVATPHGAKKGDCVQIASDRYKVPQDYIYAILAVEGGEVGQAVPNSNGTEDLGPMQINTVWLPELETHGISREQLQHDRCINILAGTWILSRQLKAAKEMGGPTNRRFWWAIGAYHSRTPQHNVKYAVRVSQALQRIRAERGPDRSAPKAGQRLAAE